MIVKGPKHSQVLHKQYPDNIVSLNDFCCCTCSLRVYSKYLPGIALFTYLTLLPATSQISTHVRRLAFFSELWFWINRNVCSFTKALRIM